MRLAVFASGGGSNFQSIVDASIAGSLRADVVLCVTNRAKAGVLERARVAGIATLVSSPAEFTDPAEYVDSMLSSLREQRVDFVALAGYMQKIPRALVAAFEHRMVNIHPALLPDFGGKGLYGMRVHRAVIASGATRSGATVHLVDDSYDTGPIVLQESVPVLEGDTPEQLAARVLTVEHRLYPRALGLFADGLVRVSGRDVHLLKSSS